MSTTITERDRRDAADFGTTPEVEATRRDAQERDAAAWSAFAAYVRRADHDTRSEEYARLSDEYVRAQRELAAAERACVAAAL
jgi:hypothetical protein